MEEELMRELSYKLISQRLESLKTVNEDGTSSLVSLTLTIFFIHQLIIFQWIMYDQPSSQI